MSTPYIGEIRMFGGNFAPQGWVFCNGQQLSISEYDTLFNLIGTTYGGDGQSTFQVPNLGSRVPVHQGQGSGSAYTLGQMAGTETVTLSTQQLPVHSHPLIVSNNAGDSNTPQQNQALASMGPAESATLMNTYAPPSGANQVTLAGTSIMPAGGSQPHTNIQPSLGINFIISLFGIYPSQT